MSAGTVCVEFDLDFSKFEKAEQKVKDSSKSTAATVETDFKKAGSASETVFESIGKSASSSFEEVKTHAKGTAEAIFSSMSNAAKGIMDDIKTATASYTQGIRDFASKTGEFLKDTAEKIALIGGTFLLFGKAAASTMASVLSWVGIIYAAYKSLEFVIGLFTGKSYKSEHIDALIAERDAVRDLAKELGTTTTAAQEMKTAMKMLGGEQSTLTTVYGGMRTALRDNREELDRLGIQYADTNGQLLDQKTILGNVKTELEKYADGWDRTQAEQAIGMGSLAQINQVLSINGEALQKAREDLEKYHLGIGPETTAATEEYQAAMTAFKYETDMMSQGFSRAIADQIMPAFTSLSKMFAGGWPFIVDTFRYSAAAITTLLWGIANAFNLTVDVIKGSASVIADIFIMIGKAAAATMRGDFAGAAAAVSDGWKNIKTSVSKTWDEMVTDSTKAGKAMGMAWAFDERKSGAKATGKTWAGALADDMEAAGKGGRQMADMLSALTKQNKEYYDSATKSADAWAAKQRADYAYEGDVIQECYDKRETALDTWYDKQWDIIEQNVADEKKRYQMLDTLNLEYGRKQETDQTNQLVAYTKFTKTKMATEYSSYSAIQGYGRKAYDVKVQLLEEERKKVYAETGNETLAYQYMQEKKIEAFIAYAEKEGTAAEGWKAGLLKIQRDTVSWGKTMVKLTDSIYTNMSKGFSDIFYDSVTGDFKGLEEYAKSFGKSVLRSFTDMIGQMAAQKVTAFFTTEWASEGTSVIGTLAKIVGYAGSALDDLNLGEYFGVSFSQGGRVNYDDGGAVAGRARYPGDHPGNDTVPAWLSPGEVVVRRSSVNPQTEKILDYINRYGMIPADMYYAGGPVAGMVTNQPYRGYWGFDTFLSILTGGISDMFQGNTWGAATVEGIQQAVEDTFGTNTFASQVLTSMLMPAEAANYDIKDILQGEGSVTEKFAAVFDRMADPTNSVNYSLERFGTYLPASVRQSAATIGSVIGTMIYPVAGTALGYGIGAHLQGKSSEEAMRGAGTAATASYIAGEVADYVSNTIYDTLAYDYGMIFTDAQIKAMNLAGKLAGGLTAGLTRMGIGAVESGFLADKILGSKYKITAQWGNSDWLFNLLSDLGGTVGKEGVYSAKTGLDYVPRDNFLVNTHKGEKILTKEEADNYRNGKGGVSIGNIQIYLDGQEVGGKMKIIADGVIVERNSRGVNLTSRVYQ